MTPLPKKRHSRKRQGMRRAAIKLSVPGFSPCPNCGKMRLPHTVCPECGVYGGRVVSPPKVKATVKKLTPKEAKVESK